MALDPDRGRCIGNSHPAGASRCRPVDPVHRPERSDYAEDHAGELPPAQIVVATLAHHDSGHQDGPLPGGEHVGPPE